MRLGWNNQSKRKGEKKKLGEIKLIIKPCPSYNLQSVWHG